MTWPTMDEFMRAAPLPEGVTLRAWTDAELSTLPALLRTWYPTIGIGAESVFLEREVLQTQLASSSHPERNLFAFAICRDGEVVGFQSFEREVAARTLHARLGVLAPEARAGFLGALGFMLFETLGSLVGAELLLVWVTLASKGQQLFAERRGFSLSGLVPAFAREAEHQHRDSNHPAITQLESKPLGGLRPAHRGDLAPARLACAREQGAVAEAVGVRRVADLEVFPQQVRAQEREAEEDQRDPALTLGKDQRAHAQGEEGTPVPSATNKITLG